MALEIPTIITGDYIVQEDSIKAIIILTLVVEIKKILSDGTFGKYKIFKKIRIRPNTKNKFKTIINLQNGNYRVYAFYENKRIGEPEAFAYYGKSEEIEFIPGENTDLSTVNIQKVPKEIEKILITDVIVPGLDNDFDGCEWRIKQLEDGVEIGDYLINNVMNYPINSDYKIANLFEKFTIAKYGSTKPAIELEMGKYHILNFYEMDGVAIDNNSHGYLHINATDKEIIIISGTKYKITDIKHSQDLFVGIDFPGTGGRFGFPLTLQYK
ncbi:hypothetical protein [Flavobacterium sp.]|uniref:hypothetical protein n=1 Tax=Flavobacterium sp. TaxID=239 RepID=UPI003751EAD4